MLSTLELGGDTPVLTDVPTTSAGYTVAITANTDFELSCTGVDDVGDPLEVSAPSLGYPERV